MAHQHNRSQCIHCNVESCEYNDKQNLCDLESIQVSPKPGCGSGKTDESLCSSYRSRGK